MTFTLDIGRFDKSGNAVTGAALDTVPGDIQPLGVRAAGASGQAADASHVHPMPTLNQVLAPTADVALGGHKATGAADATNPTDLVNLETADGRYAGLASPAFTGNPTAPTQLPADSSTRLASTAFVQAAAAAVSTKVAINNVAQTPRGTIDFRGTRRVVATASDDAAGNATHITIDERLRSPSIGFGRIKYDNVGGTYPLSTADCQQRGYELLILQTLMATGGGDTAAASGELATNNAIRANNAQPVKILMYRVAIERASDTSGDTTFTRPSANTAPMYLYDSTGAKYTQNFAGGNPQMDFGNAAYQAAAVSRAITMCLAGGYDGIFIDNVLASPIANGYYTSLLPPTGTLSSDANYNAAWDSFLTYCKAQFNQAGLTCVMGNAGGTIEVADMVPIHVAHMNAGMDGILNESFLTQFSSTSTVFNPNTIASPLNSDTTPVVTNTFQIAAAIQAPKFVAVHSYIQGFANGGVNASDFYVTICSALLFDNCVYIVDNDTDSTGVAPLTYNNYTVGRPAGPWMAYYDRARELGKPIGPYFSSNSIWMRYFQNGVVLVNNTNGSLVEPITGLTITAHQSDIFLYRKVRAVLPYSTSITPIDPTYGRYQRTVANNATAFTINAPVNTPQVLDYQEFTLEIHNVSGGALGAITWNALYVFPTAWVSPATGKSRFAKFEWNGTNWIATNVASADF